MNALIRQEVKVLRSMGYNSCCFYPDDKCFQGSPYIDLYATGHIALDVYTWERDMTGDVSAWDVEQYDLRRLTIAFPQSREGFRRAYRSARLCVRVPQFYRH